MYWERISHLCVFIQNLYKVVEILQNLVLHCVFNPFGAILHLCCTYGNVKWGHWEIWINLKMQANGFQQPKDTSDEDDNTGNSLCPSHLSSWSCVGFLNVSLLCKSPLGRHCRWWREGGSSLQGFWEVFCVNENNKKKEVNKKNRTTLRLYPSGLHFSGSSCSNYVMLALFHP